MQPLTEETPKSLVQVGGAPFLDYLIDELTSWSALDAIHVAVNNVDAPAFREWAAGHRPTLHATSINLHVHDDGVETPAEQLGMVGDLQFLLQEVGIPSDGALVTGGDSLYRFPLPPILNAYDGATNQVLALYEPVPERRAHSSLLKIDGQFVTEIVEDPSGAASERICPSWTLLSPEALAIVEEYLSDDGPPDEFGPFLNRVAHEHSVRAVRLPKQKDLRLHCNTVEELERARRLVRDEPRHVLAPDTVRNCLFERDA